MRELSPVGMWKGEAMTLRLPLKDLKTMGGDCLIALLQVENAGPILGAAEYEVAATAADRPSPERARSAAKKNGPATDPFYAVASGMKWPGPREDPGGAGGLRSEDLSIGPGREATMHDHTVLWGVPTAELGPNCDLCFVILQARVSAGIGLNFPKRRSS